MSQNEITAFQKRNELVIPDASPLIYLAKMDLLDLLPAMYERILITDVVWMEATRHADKFEDAARTLKWGGKLQASEPNRLIIAETTLGRGIQAIMKEDPSFHERDAGENSIVEWAGKAADDLRFQAMHPDILYENGRVPRLVASLNLPVTTLNTIAFLRDAADAGYLVTLKQVFDGMSEIQVHFNLEPSVQHNEAALKALSDNKEQPQAEKLKMNFQKREDLEN